MNDITQLKECPHCKFNLDDGDIYEVLRGHESYKKYSDEEVKQFAGHYGWTETNRIHGSKLIGVDLKYMCPNCNMPVMA